MLVALAFDFCEFEFLERARKWLTPLREFLVLPLQFLQAAQELYISLIIVLQPTHSLQQPLLLFRVSCALFFPITE